MKPAHSSGQDLKQDPGPVFNGTAILIFPVVDGRREKSAQEEEMGSAVSSVKTITSSELLQGLDSQQFGSLILDYLPEMMDKETVITWVRGTTPLMRKIMEDNLPDGDFGTKELDAFFAFLAEKRREVKKEILEEESIIRLYGGGVPADVRR